MVHDVPRHRPDPAVYDFLQHDFDALERALRRRRRRRASGRSRRFRSATSSGSRSSRRARPTLTASTSSRCARTQQPTRYTEDDLHVRQFLRDDVATADVASAQFRAA